MACAASPLDVSLHPDARASPHQIDSPRMNTNNTGLVAGDDRHRAADHPVTVLEASRWSGDGHVDHVATDKAARHLERQLNEAGIEAGASHRSLVRVRHQGILAPRAGR